MYVRRPQFLLVELLSSSLILTVCAVVVLAVPSMYGQVPGGVETSASRLNRTPSPTPASTAVKLQPLTAILAADGKGKDPASSFPVNTRKIFAVYSDGFAVKGDSLRFVWTAESGGASAKNKPLYESKVTLPGPVGTSSSFVELSGSGFPVGKYRLDIYKNARLAKSLPFTVAK